MANKKETLLITIVLLIVAGGLFVVYRYQKRQEQTATISKESTTSIPSPHSSVCDYPLRYRIYEDYSTTTRATVPWLTYKNKTYHYKFDYPYILILNTDSQFPNVQFDNPPFSINVLVSGEQFSYYHGSLDEFLEKSAPMGMRLEKRIKIDGYDAIVVSNENDRKEKTDVLITLFIKDKSFFGIRTQCVDHERIWNSFRFEE